MPRTFSGPPPVACTALCAVVLLAAVVCGGCGKKTLPGYGPDPASPPPVPTMEPLYDATTLPEGWGYVDVLCAEGVNRQRHLPDTLYGCLLHARDSGEGVVLLPHGVFLGHVSRFVVEALRYYHVEEHFASLYGCRIVLVFRPATEAELARHDDAVAGRIGLGLAGEAVLTVVAGAPLVPIVAPLSFAFESVREDLRFQRFRKDAARHGLPAPTRRGDEITADEYAARYEGYWDAVNGDGDAAEDETPRLYMVEECYLQRSGRPPLRLVGGGERP